MTADTGIFLQITTAADVRLVNNAEVARSCLRICIDLNHDGVPLAFRKWLGIYKRIVPDTEFKRVPTAVSHDKYPRETTAWCLGLKGFIEKRDDSFAVRID